MPLAASSFLFSASDPLQQFRRWLVVRVLRHEFAAHGEVEDGLAELLDLVGARGEGGSASSAKRASSWKVSGSGALRRARLAAASRSRVASRSARAASSRSHSAINSSTLATMRCCSARGGRGKASREILVFGTRFWPAVPVIRRNTSLDEVRAVERTCRM